MRIIAVDPGKQGAVAVLDDHQLIRLFRTPTIGKEYDEDRMYQIIGESRAPGHVRDSAFVIEAPSARQGEAPQSAMKIGAGYGLWRGFAVAWGLQRHVVASSSWKAKMGLSPKRARKGEPLPSKLSPKERKDLAIAMAVQMCPGWPALRRDGCAEAYLIGVWAHRFLFGRNTIT